MLDTCYCIGFGWICRKDLALIMAGISEQQQARRSAGSSRTSSEEEHMHE